MYIYLYGKGYNKDMINYKDYWDQKVDVKLIWFDECFFGMEWEG